MSIKRFAPFLFITILVLFFAVSTISVQGQDTVNSAPPGDSTIPPGDFVPAVPSHTPKPARPKGKSSKAQVQRCERRKAQITKKLEKFNKHSDHPKITKLIDRITQLITKAKAKNVDTTKLEADLATLKTKAEGCKNAYGLFIAKLTATKSFVCDATTKAQFKTALAAAKVEKEKAKVACRDAKNFARDTIKKDLKDLKKLLRVVVATTPTSTPTP